MIFAVVQSGSKCTAGGCNQYRYCRNAREVKGGAASWAVGCFCFMEIRSWEWHKVLSRLSGLQRFKASERFRKGLWETYQVWPQALFERGQYDIGSEQDRYKMERSRRLVPSSICAMQFVIASICAPGYRAGKSKSLPGACKNNVKLYQAYRWKTAECIQYHYLALLV